MMKRFLQRCYLPCLWAIVGMMGLTSACSDEREGEEPLPVYPTMPCRQIELAETIVEDGHSITITRTYSYEEGRICAYRFLQSYYLQDVEEPFRIEDNTGVRYSQGEASVEDGYGNTWEYTLDAEGRATACTYREKAGNLRTYAFGYTACADGKRRLAYLEEYIGEGAAVPYASIRLEYEEDGTRHITQQVGEYGHSFTAIPFVTDEGKNLAELPCIFLAELYPLSQHHIALYGKLLGESPEYLPAQVTPDGNAESGETTTYTYRFNEAGIPTFCQQTTQSYGKSYSGYVTYTIE